MTTTTRPDPAVHEINPGDRVKICDYQNGMGLNDKLATVTTSNKSGYYLKVDGMKAIVHLSNLEGAKCLIKLTSVQESGQGLPLQELPQVSSSKDSQKKTSFAQKFFNSDTPELSTMETSAPKRGRGRPKKPVLSEAEVSISSPPALPASPSPSKETAEAKTTLETASPLSSQELSELTPTTGRSKMSPAYSQSTTGSTSDTSLNGLTSAGLTVNGLPLAAATLEAPTLERDCLFLESPGALGSGTSGANPPGQNRLEGQLKEIGSIGTGEVSNPEFLEASMGLPIGWTDPREKRTAMELLAAAAKLENAAKPSEISSIPKLQPSPSIELSTIPQIDPDFSKAWIYPEQIEEVSFTQIRESVDSEAIARYAELMQSELWDFERSPIPVLFEHENRYLIGDGHHRIEAARKIGADILCEIFPAVQIEDALIYSIKAIENTNHGLPLRPKDQRKRIVMFLDLLDAGKCSIALPEDYKEWSSRAIATYLNLPESGYRTIANIRKEREKPPEEPPIIKALKAQNPPPPSTRPASGGGSIATVDIEERPTIPSTPTNDTHDPTINTLPPTNGAHLSDQELEKLGLLTSLGRSINNVINLIEQIKDAELSRISEAIEVEKVRRLNLAKE